MLPSRTSILATLDGQYDHLKGGICPSILAINIKNQELHGRLTGLVLSRTLALVSTAAIPRVPNHQPCQKPKPNCDITKPAVITDIDTQHVIRPSLLLGIVISRRKNSAENNIRPTRPSSNQI